MRYKLTLLVLLQIFIFNFTYAQSKDEKVVTAAVEKLRKAMVDADSLVLATSVTDQLNYGHSGGHIDYKKEFVEKIVSGKSDFVSIELANQTIILSDKTAIVRHDLNGKTNDSGKSSEVHLHVMMVWQKIKGDWKLLARQAIKRS